MEIFKVIIKYVYQIIYCVIQYEKQLKQIEKIFNVKQKHAIECLNKEQREYLSWKVTWGIK